MTDYRATVKHLLANFVVFLMLANVAWTVFFVVYGEVEHYFWALLLPFALFYCIRRWVQNVWSFVLLHVLISAGAVIFLADEHMWPFVLGFVIVGGIWSFVARAKNRKGIERFSPVVLLHITLFLALDIFAANAGNAQILIVLNFIMATGFYILHTHMDNVDYRVRVLQTVEHYDQPVRRVLAFNNKMIALYTAGLVAFGFIGVIFPIGRAVTQLIGWILWPIRRQFGRVPNAVSLWLLSPEQPIPPPFEGLPVEEYISDYDYGVVEHLYRPELSLDDIETIMSFFVVIMWFGVVVITTILLYVFYTEFVRKRWRKKAATHENDEAIALEGSILGDLRSFFFRKKGLPRNAIRRAYAKKVNRHIKDGVNINASDTTEIIAEKIRPREDIDELTALYDGVRYGGNS